MNQRLFFTVTLLIAVYHVTAVPASAQDPQPAARPYRGLFGGGVGNLSQQTGLNLTLGGGFYDDLTKFAPTTGVPSVNPAIASSRFGTGTVSIGHNIKTARVSGDVMAGAQIRYVPAQSSPVSGTYTASAQVSASLGARTRLSSSYLSGVFLRNRAAFYGNQVGILSDPTRQSDPTNQVDPTAFTDQGTFRSGHADVQLSHLLTKRIALRAGYAYYTNDVWVVAGRGRYSVRDVNGGVSYALAKGLSLRLGYGTTSSRNGGAAAGLMNYRARTIDGGVEFGRSLSISRRSSLSFSTGAAGLSDANSRIQYYFTGHLNYRYELGRSWNLSLAHYRTASLDQTLGQPVLRKFFTAGLGGLIGRRVHANASARLLGGDVGIGSSGSGYSAVMADAGVTYGITRELAIGATYTFYRHDFGGVTPLPPGLMSITKGQTVGVSLRLWVPLLTQARRP